MVEIPVTPADFASWCEAEGIHTVVADVGDVHGIWRGKRLPLAEFVARLGRGIPFSDAVRGREVPAAGVGVGGPAVRRNGLTGGASADLDRCGHWYDT